MVEYFTSDNETKGLALMPTEKVVLRLTCGGCKKNEVFQIPTTVFVDWKSGAELEDLAHGLTEDALDFLALNRHPACL